MYFKAQVVLFHGRVRNLVEALYLWSRSYSPLLFLVNYPLNIWPSHGFFPRFRPSNLAITHKHHTYILTFVGIANNVNSGQLSGWFNDAMVHELEFSKLKIQMRRFFCQFCVYRYNILDWMLCNLRALELIHFTHESEIHSSSIVNFYSFSWEKQETN